jgi:uncharacterized protein with GYD domain
MPRYMVCAKLSPAGVAGFRSDGYVKREEAVRAAWEAVGATVEAYFVASPADPWNVVAIGGTVKSAFSWHGADSAPHDSW